MGYASCIPLLYKNRCILCNEIVKLYSNNQDFAEKNYSQPDNLTSGELMNRFVKAADDRLAIDSNDKWAIEVKGRLLGINDLVAEEALLHKLCSTKFLNFRDLRTEQGGGRKIDEDREALLIKLCDWLDNEMEHNLFTLDQVHEKMRSLDQTADKSLAYSKRYLKEKLKQKYDDAIYFTSQERQADVLCFKDASANIIRDYHNDIGDDEKQESSKL